MQKAVPLAAGAFAAALSASVASAQVNVVALSDDLAPGTSDPYTQFFFPAISDTGQVAFTARLGLPAGNVGGSFVASADGTVEPVALLGGPSPLAGYNYSLLRIATAIDAEGRVALSAEATDTLGNPASLALVGPAPSPLVVARDGDTFGGVTIEFVGAPGITRTGGNVLLPVNVAGYDDDLGFEALLRDTGSGLVPIAVGGQAAPGTTDTYRDFFGGRIAGDGRVLFTAELTDASLSEDTALYATDAAGTTSLLLREGDAVSGESGAVYGGFGTSNFSAGGEAVVGARIEESIFGDPLGQQLLRYDGGSTLTEIARTGETSFGGDLLTEIYRPRLNDAGDLIFGGDTDAFTDSFDSAFRQLAGGEIERLVRLGDAVDYDGQAGTVAFVDSVPLLAEDGTAVLALALIDGESTLIEDSLGYYTVGLDGAIAPLITAGDEVEVEPGVFVGVGNLFGSTGSINTLELASGAINDDGLLVLAVPLDDGRSAMVTVAVPEPTAAVGLLGVGLPALLRRRRRAV